MVSLLKWITLFPIINIFDFLRGIINPRFRKNYAEYHKLVDTLYTLFIKVDTKDCLSEDKK